MLQMWVVRVLPAHDLANFESAHSYLAPSPRPCHRLCHIGYEQFEVFGRFRQLGGAVGIGNALDLGGVSISRELAGNS